MDNILEDIENEFQLTNQIKKILQPKGNIAFLDAEFNQKDKQQYELISVAIVICDCNFVEIDKYYKVVCKYKDGLVNEIVIVNPEDQILEDENNITTNTNENTNNEEGNNSTLNETISENVENRNSKESSK